MASTKLQHDADATEVASDTDPSLRPDAFEKLLAAAIALLALVSTALLRSRRMAGRNWAECLAAPWQSCCRSPLLRYSCCGVAAICFIASWMGLGAVLHCSGVVHDPRPQ